MGKRNILTAAVVAAGLQAAAGPVAAAGLIERACNSSDRSSSRSLCNCIQRVADATLDRRDQMLAAKFFDDPHMAQEIRQSDRRSDEVFWKKYKFFGRSAEGYCR